MVRRSVVAVACVGLSLQAAPAAEVSGNPALSLAARVGDRAPRLSLWQRGILSVYLDGRPKARYLGSGTVEVKADAIDCWIGNVDITAKDCTLTFGAKKVHVRGRDAQALYATLIEAGVAPSGAAGSMHASVTNLVCTVDPAAIREAAGGGATCSFSPGP